MSVALRASSSRSPRSSADDLRYSAHLLLKHPGFTLTAVGIPTLGIGVNAGIFGIINGLMIRLAMR
jgi:hypothetical protein